MLSARVASRVPWKVRTVTDAPPGNGALGNWGVARRIVYVLHPPISAVITVEEGRSALLTCE
jgi:hypothetical protein